MKTIIICFLVLFSIPSSSQEIDSSWVSAFIPSLSKDTGKFLPQVSLVDVNGNEKKISDFKGKILYIDIWATSCGPCIGKFPFSEQLLKRLKAIQLDTAITFINICTGDSRKKWKKLLQKHHPSGQNFYSPSTEVKWDIDAFPTYLIIDRTGKVMTADATSPDDATIDYLLYAATKGIKPTESIWTFFIQSKYREVNSKFTDDATGIDYSRWYNSIRESLFEFSKWRTQYMKKYSR